MNRHTGRLTAGIETLDHSIIAVFIDSQRLTINISRDTTHHVVTGWNNRDRFFHRISMGKGSRQLQNTGQLGIQGFFPKMIKLEINMVSIWTTATTF